MLHRILLHAAALFLGFAVLAGQAAADGDVKGPQYRLKAGETYVYSITIVGDIGAATETSKGTIQLTVKSADSNQIVLTPFVSLTTQVKQPPGQFAPGRKGFGPKRPFQFFGKSRFVSQRELTIDPFGQILKFSGETHLPLLLGTAEELIIEPLSAKGEARWQRERDLVLKDENDVRTPAKEVATYALAGSQGGTTTIKKTYDFKTTAPNEAPRVHVEGTSEILFDTQAGLIKSGSYKGTIVITEKNVTLRIPLTASYRLMTAEEVATTKKEAEAARVKGFEAAKAAAAPKAVSDADITLAVGELKAGGFKVQFAADRLAKALPVDSRRDEVVAALNTVLKDRDGFQRRGSQGAQDVGDCQRSGDVHRFVKGRQHFCPACRSGGAGGPAGSQGRGGRGSTAYRFSGPYAGGRSA